MMRIVVILVVIAALGHDVSSRPQSFPLDPTSFLGGSSSNNNNGAPFGCNPANLLKPDTIAAFVPIPGGQAQATSAPAESASAPAPAPAKKKRSPIPF